MPDGYTFVDAGIRMGDNAGISYYELKERTYKMDAEAKAIGVAICTVTSILSGDINTFDASASEKYYDERENSVLDEMSASTLADYMMQNKPVNVEKYPPIYWEANAQTKAVSGSMATLPPLHFIQKNNGQHYIYGVGYLKYKTPQGTLQTIYTDALPTTRDNIPTYAVTKSGESAAPARQSAPARMMARSMARKAPASGSTEDNLDLRYVFAPETQLTVYVDGQWSADLSATYGFGDKVTLVAPAVSGKTFAYWEADGQPLSTAQTLALTMNASTTLRAVYDGSAPASAKVGFTSVTRSGSNISLQAIADAEATEAGIIYSTTATGDALTIGASGVTQVAATPAQQLDGATQMPASILDANNNWMLQITPADQTTVYHARAYATVGGTTTYGSVRDVTLADLESGVRSKANLSGFELGLAEALTTVKATIIPVTYTATMAPDTEDAENWVITPSTDINGGDTVTVTYKGKRRVKSVKAVVVPAE
ncbi:MAG: hypothetical protein IJ243_10860 [Prevotella sp.]|nr:hypothetical protein [Prevotella sp.]